MAKLKMLTYKGYRIYKHHGPPPGQPYLKARDYYTVEGVKTHFDTLADAKTYVHYKTEKAQKKDKR